MAIRYGVPISCPRPHGQCQTRTTLAHATPCSPVDHNLKPWGEAVQHVPLAQLCHTPGWHVPQLQQGLRSHFLCTERALARSSSFLEKLRLSRLGGETEAQSWDVAAQL